MQSETDWMDNLQVLDSATLPPVFSEAADFARTDGRLTEGLRTHRHNADRHEFVNSRKQSAADRILQRLPEPGEVLHIVLDGSFDLCHLIPRVIELAGESVERLDLATLGFNDATLDILTQLSEAGRVRHIRLLCSHYFKSVDTTLWSRAHRELTRRGHQLYVARTHIKAQAFEFASGRKLLLMSSANLRSCKNAESVLLIHNDGAHDFWRGVFDELIQEAEKCSIKK